MSSALPLPLPIDESERARVEWSALCWRVLYGRWDADLRTRITRMVGTVKERAWGQPDLSANLFRQVFDGIAAQYDAMGTIGHEADTGAATAMGGIVAGAGWWSLMQSVERDTLALREQLVRVDVHQGTPVYRQVHPHMVEIECGDAPGIPIRICESRLREVGGKWVWTRDELSIRPGAVYYRVTTRDGVDVRDLTSDVLGATYEGDAYPYRDVADVPVLPYALYHAVDRGRIWDSWGNRELVEGTLNLGVYYTFWGHCLRTASWPQRYTANLVPAGVSRGEQAQAEIETDPSSVLILLPVDTEGSAAQPMVGQWTPGADPESFLAAIRAYEERLVSFAGVNAADQLRMSGDPRSGYAVAVSRDTQRQLQRTHEPQFRRGDLEVLRLTAILMNRALGVQAYPETGWTITYAGVPLSPEERKALREDVIARIEAGLLDPVDGYVELNPGVTQAQAEAALARNREQRARFGVGGRSQP